MADAMLSSFERTFIVNGVEQDFRSDGRSCHDYRHFEVETGIVSNTSGSARLRLVWYKTGIGYSSNRNFWSSVNQLWVNARPP